MTASHRDERNDGGGGGRAVTVKDCNGVVWLLAGGGAVAVVL